MVFVFVVVVIFLFPFFFSAMQKKGRRESDVMARLNEVKADKEKKGFFRVLSFLAVDGSGLLG